MSGRRIIYQNWIVALGFDPAQNWYQSVKSPETNKKLIRAVNEVLVLLDKPEADFIRCFYFQGMTYRTISNLTGRAIYRLETLHQQALEKLRRYLKDQLKSYITEESQIKSACPLCCHGRREEIDRLIASKGERETWRRIIRQLKTEFNIEITTPQRLIGHLKYHMIGKEN